jgi:TRAP-type C4-dicarboxylate transport system permease small subunit
MQKLITRLGKFTDIVAGISITFTILLTVLDVTLRYFGKPLLGTFEIVSFVGGVLAIGFSSLFTYWEKSHVRVDTVVEILPKNIRYILNIATRVMILFIVGMTGMALIIMGFQLLEAHEVTPTLYFAYYPFVWVLGVSFLLVCFAVVYEIIFPRRFVDNE